MGLRRDKESRSPEALVIEGDRLLTGEGGNQSFDEAFYRYKKAASHGYAPAMYRLGCMYESGHGAEQSYKKAYTWYDKASLKGDLDAKAALGFLYEAGLGTKQSRPLAIEMLEDSAKAGCVRAMNNLGLIYLDRSRRDFSDHAAVTWFQKGNLQRFPPAVANLARMYETGKGLERNCSVASTLFRSSAKAGNLPAKIFLAEMLKFGIGVEAKPAAAEHLYMEAARWGNPVAVAELKGEDVEMDDFDLRPDSVSNPRTQFNYGLMFAFGVRAPYAPETAIYLLESSAGAGNTDAMYVLGQMYENGIACRKSMFLAKKWYGWGAEKGHGPCAYSLGWIAEGGEEGADPDYGLAISYYRKAASVTEQDRDALADACNALGYLLCHTSDSIDDLEEGKKNLIKASELGHPSAQYTIGCILVEEGSAEGWRYLSMAADQGDERAAEMLANRK